MSTPEMSAETKSEPCRCLCAKNMYGTSVRFSETWPPGTHESTSYWCLLTQGPAGPDEHYVHLTRCVPGRACYNAL